MPIQVWKCDYCGKQDNKHNLLIHEPICKFNPVLRNCLSCGNYNSVRSYDANLVCEVKEQIQDLNLESIGIWNWNDMMDSNYHCPLWKE